MTLQTLDILYLTLAIGFAIIVYAVFTLAKRIQKTLDHVDSILEHFRNTTEGLEDIKNKAKGTFYSVASVVLGLLFRKK